MKLKKLLAVAVAAAFTLPFAAQVSAAGDKMILAQAGASSVGTGPTGGVPSPQSAGEPKAPHRRQQGGHPALRSHDRGRARELHARRERAARCRGRCDRLQHD